MADRTPEIQKTLALMQRYAAHNYNPLPVMADHGFGAEVWDLDGKKYLDLATDYGVHAFGRNHPRLVNAAIKQLTKLPVASRILPNKPFAQFCETLAKFCGLERVLPAVDGAGAVERAIKIVRKWGYLKKGIKRGKAEIVAFYDNFHGRTYGPLSLSSSVVYRYDFGPFLAGIKYVPFGDAEKIEEYLSKNTVAVFLEPIQGEGGVIVPPDGFLKNVRRLCTENNVLMVADEIQTGLGRTGYDLACDYEQVKPDVVLLSKALGGGLVPISAVVARGDVMNTAIGLGDDGSTFGGYPLGCAVAVEAINLLQDEMLSERARSKGAYFVNRLRAIKNKNILCVRGRGLMIGVEVAFEGKARKLQLRLLEEGILCGLSHNVLRISPPLIITLQQISYAFEAFERVFR